MSVSIKKQVRKTAAKKVKRNQKTRMSAKRKKAIEKAIGFWKSHSVDMSGFKFDREEANAR